MKFIKSKKGLALLAVLAVAVVAAVGAYAYFSSTGHGSGRGDGWSVDGVRVTSGLDRSVR